MIHFQFDLDATERQWHSAALSMFRGLLAKVGVLARWYIGRVDNTYSQLLDNTPPFRTRLSGTRTQSHNNNLFAAPRSNISANLKNRWRNKREDKCTLWFYRPRTSLANRVMFANVNNKSRISSTSVINCRVRHCVCLNFTRVSDPRNRPDCARSRNFHPPWARRPPFAREYAVLKFLRHSRRSWYYVRGKS